jgi:hypothetical protein
MANMLDCHRYLYNIVTGKKVHISNETYQHYMDAGGDDYLKSAEALKDCILQTIVPKY